MAELRSAVRGLCGQLLSGKITGEEFKDQIAGLLAHYGRTGFNLQNIGLAVEAIAMDERQKEKLWHLLDKVTPGIREAVEHWKEAMR